MATATRRSGQRLLLGIPFPSTESVDSRIAETEAELTRLRKLRQVIDSLTEDDSDQSADLQTTGGRSVA